MDANTLKQYRKMALDRLEQLLIQLPEEPNDADYFVDRYIRILSDLPARPDNSPPYQGLYGSGSTLDKYRDVATDRLQELVEELSGLQKVDEEVDKYIRVLSDLPPRPEDVEPYVRLFVIRPPQSPPDELISGQTPSGKQFITSQQLIQIAGSNRFKSRLETFTPGVNATFEKYQINTKLRIAHFLAQVMHESGGFQWLKELWGPTAAQRTYEPNHRKARELGNTQKGDGFRYRGRGLIQLTGRGNYKRFSDAINVDCVAKPDLVAEAPYAVYAAGWYWNSRSINNPADQDNLREVTRRINGGYNGLADRAKYLKRAKLVLKI